MTATNSSNVILERTLRLLRQPVVGPLTIGTLAGGIPSGLLLFHLGLSDTWGDRFFVSLTPVVVLVAAIGAIMVASSGPARLLGRALLTSLSACIPAPTIVWTILASRSRFEMLDPRNLPYAAVLFVLWALAVALLGWLLALAFVFLSHRKGKTSSGNDGGGAN